MCCDRQASSVTWSLGVTVRNSSRKMLVLLDLARRKSREILEHGVRRVASQGESGRFLGKSRELALGSQALKRSAPGADRECKAWVLEIARVTTKSRSRQDRRYKVLCLGIIELVLIAVAYSAANWNLIKGFRRVPVSQSTSPFVVVLVVVVRVVVEKRSR